MFKAPENILAVATPSKGKGYAWRPNDKFAFAEPREQRKKKIQKMEGAWETEIQRRKIDCAAESPKSFLKFQRWRRGRLKKPAATTPTKSGRERMQISKEDTTLYLDMGLLRVGAIRMGAKKSEVEVRKQNK
jgi:hypothetical protein